ncbi:hypothetical protein ACJ72_08296 [Emergomyces africanus]|uniref:Uncharacterized protein n=1 Tax=Emergomyces africanus TaxID=1955775 RepID=A0A1B7NKU4_9EURO|nr:hypothetical protein ACJ72_08296 [Emergomyces africanus]
MESRKDSDRVNQGSCLDCLQAPKNLSPNEANLENKPTEALAIRPRQIINIDPDVIKDTDTTDKLFMLSVIFRTERKLESKEKRTTRKGQLG